MTQQLDRTAVNLEAKRNEKPNKAPSTILLTSANTTAAAAAAAHQNATFCPHMIKNNNRCCALRRPLTSGRMFTAIFPSTLNASNFFLLFPTAVKDRKPVSLGLLSLSLSLCVQSVPPCPVLEWLLSRLSQSLRSFRRCCCCCRCVRSLLRSTEPGPLFSAGRAGGGEGWLTDWLAAPGVKDRDEEGRRGPLGGAPTSDDANPPPGCWGHRVELAITIVYGRSVGLTN